MEEFRGWKEEVLIQLGEALLEVFIIFPIIEMITGTEILSGDKLTKEERALKGVSAAISLLTLGGSCLTAKGAGLAFQEILIYAGRTLAIDAVAVGTSYGVGQLCEELGLPAPLTVIFALAAGMAVSMVGTKFVFKDSLGNVQFEYEGGFNPSFADNVEDILSKEGLTLDEFNKLRLQNVSTLTDAERATLKAIRDSVPMPDSNTLMQKVIPVGDIQKYLDGTYTQVGGFVSRADDVMQLKNYDDIYNSLRLDYPNTAYNITSDDSLAVIRYTTSEPTKFDIPYSSEFGGIATGEPPFTGNGFTMATNGQIIPEYRCSSFTKIDDGAQLIKIGKDGTETLIAIYDVDFGRFILVDK